MNLLNHWKEKSIAVQAGVQILPPPLEGRTLVFPRMGKEGWEDFRMTLKPLSFKVHWNMTLEKLYSAAATAIDAAIFYTIRTDNRINWISPGDDLKQYLYRMIASVEEKNAEFEGFVTHPNSDLPNPCCGYPVYYDRSLLEGVVLGGKWSDGVLIVDPNVTIFESPTEGLLGQIEIAFAMKHPEAFVICDRSKK